MKEGIKKLNRITIIKDYKNYIEVSDKLLFWYVFKCKQNKNKEFFFLWFFYILMAFSALLSQYGGLSIVYSVLIYNRW